MRRAARTDRNHGEIVKALRQIGCSVQSLAAVGKGVPDIIVGRHKRNVLLEIKDHQQPPSGRALTEDEREWHALWAGQVATVETAEQAIRVVLAATVE